jgi:hypothetical protein
MRFVLVHGTSRDAWCRDLLVPELNALGHEAVAVDLLSHGTRMSEAATLAADRDASVTADARPDLIGHLTPLAGPLPVEGKPLSSQSTSALICGSSSAADSEESVSEDNIKFTEDRSAFNCDRDGAYVTSYQDCDEKLVDWAAERLTPQAMVPVIEPVSISRPAGPDLPRSYMICRHDQASPPRVSKRQARRLGVAPLEVDSAHSPFFSGPAELAALPVDATTIRPIRPQDISATAASRW